MSHKMSLTYVLLLLLLLLLLISLHACEARSLRTFDEKLEEKPHYFFSKNNINEKGSEDSWSVPYKKKIEENPGISLDYSPPDSNPPSHNTHEATMDIGYDDNGF